MFKNYDFEKFSCVFLFILIGFSLVLFSDALQFADAKKSQGTPYPVINSKNVCGISLCDEPLSMEEKIKIYLGIDDTAPSVRPGMTAQQSALPGQQGIDFETLVLAIESEGHDFERYEIDGHVGIDLKNGWILELFADQVTMGIFNPLGFWVNVNLSTGEVIDYGLEEGFEHLSEPGDYETFAMSVNLPEGVIPGLPIGIPVGPEEIIVEDEDVMEPIQDQSDSSQDTPIEMEDEPLPGLEDLTPPGTSVEAEEEPLPGLEDLYTESCTDEYDCSIDSGCPYDVELCDYDLDVPCTEYDCPEPGIEDLEESCEEDCSDPLGKILEEEELERKIQEFEENMADSDGDGIADTEETEMEQEQGPPGEVGSPGIPGSQGLDENNPNVSREVHDDGSVIVTTKNPDGSTQEETFVDGNLREIETTTLTSDGKHDTTIRFHGPVENPFKYKFETRSYYHPNGDFSFRITTQLTSQTIIFADERSVKINDYSDKIIVEYNWNKFDQSYSERGTFERTVVSPQLEVIDGIPILTIQYRENEGRPGIIGEKFEINSSGLSSGKKFDPAVIEGADEMEIEQGPQGEVGLAGEEGSAGMPSIEDEESDGVLSPQDGVPEFYQWRNFFTSVDLGLPHDSVPRIDVEIDDSLVVDLLLDTLTIQSESGTSFIDYYGDEKTELYTTDEDGNVIELITISLFGPGKTIRSSTNTFVYLWEGSGQPDYVNGDYRLTVLDKNGDFQKIIVFESGWPTLEILPDGTQTEIKPPQVPNLGIEYDSELFDLILEGDARILEVIDGVAEGEEAYKVRVTNESGISENKIFDDNGNIDIYLQLEMEIHTPEEVNRGVDIFSGEFLADDEDVEETEMESEHGPQGEVGLEGEQGPTGTRELTIESDTTFSGPEDNPKRDSTKTELVYDENKDLVYTIITKHRGEYLNTITIDFADDDKKVQIDHLGDSTVIRSGSNVYGTYEYSNSISNVVADPIFTLDEDGLPIVTIYYKYIIGNNESLIGEVWDIRPFGTSRSHAVPVEAEDIIIPEQIVPETSSEQVQEDTVIEKDKDETTPTPKTESEKTDSEQEIDSTSNLDAVSEESSDTIATESSLLGEAGSITEEGLRELYPDDKDFDGIKDNVDTDLSEDGKIISKANEPSTLFFSEDANVTVELLTTSVSDPDRPSNLPIWIVELTEDKEHVLITNNTGEKILINIMGTVFELDPLTVIEVGFGSIKVEVIEGGIKIHVVMSDGSTSIISVSEEQSMLLDDESFTITEAGSIIKQQSTVMEPKQKVPEWIKSNAEWWSSDLIGDKDFTEGIKFMIEKDIIYLPDLKTETEVAGGVEPEIPSWIKSNAEWWAADLISEKDFVSGITYLVEVGIIPIY